MNRAELHNKMIAAARTIAPDERVPYAFEKRIMARLVPAQRLDAWVVWSRALWKAAAPCVAIMLLCGAWTFFSQQASVKRDWAKTDFSQEFDKAVLASASPDEAW